ncbi:muconolactone Delta-isomerase family protein [Amycolatopsis thermalba]|uniref:Muconolactone Delta-isomerase family protein n=1 Tax=Amycolatopsis thermalba TaxID=944492 RepID=A0ABY4P160_9PSEU|nr:MULTISPECIES: muconolactone Delta-isomerase family protein [Amycolatopsis]UQS25973.1 muconolactone Delta-isomerase family protein [Amycolatopsis thermalba]
MEFLVRITVTRPDGLDEKDWSGLLERERAHATDYQRKGHILRIWRVPGTSANVGVWQAQDATDCTGCCPACP